MPKYNESKFERQCRMNELKRRIGRTPYITRKDVRRFLLVQRIKLLFVLLFAAMLGSHMPPLTYMYFPQEVYVLNHKRLNR